MKIIILILTGSGLLYQTAIIFDQFMSGKTVVRLEIGNNKDNSPPAITVCYPGLYSMERVANYSNNTLFNEFNEFNKTYTDFLKNNRNKAMQYYSGFFRHWTLQNLKNNDLDIKRLFDNFSVKYKDLDGKYIFLISFFGDMNNNTLPGEFLIRTNKSYSLFFFIGDPLESIVFRQLGSRLEYHKCLTFFSHVQKKWRDFYAQLYVIIIGFNRLASDKSFPFYTDYYISIHSPST